MTEQDQKDSNVSKEDNFEDLLEGSLSGHERFEPGQLIEAEIVKISGEWIFIDTGGKSEGHLEVKEFTDENGDLTVKEGDKISAYFMSSQNGEMHFTTKIGGDKAGRSALQNAYENGIPVEGLVEKEIKGGYDVKLGNLRAFCPYSQMGLERENPEKYIGKHMPFKITEFAENGRNIIISNRAIEEEERQAKIDELRETLKQGMVVKGIIKSIQDFGAFVDIGGVQALLPISEISRERVEDIRQTLSVGQNVEAALLSLDWENDRISISMKEIQPDPWDKVNENYTKGSRYKGKIVRLTNFGAFVTLEPGLDGLIHISDLGAGKRIKHPKEVVKQGQIIEVQINSIDVDKKRISLAPLNFTKEEETLKQYTDKNDNSFKPMGNLGELLKGKLDK